MYFGRMLCVSSDALWHLSFIYILQDSRLTPFIAHMLTSETYEHVQRALKIIVAAAHVADFDINM